MSALSGMVEHPWDASTGGAKVAGLPQAADRPGLHEQVNSPGAPGKKGKQNSAF